MTLRTVVVDYRKGNLKSVERGLAAAGADAFISDDPAAIAAADAVVLPGVGAFADAATTMAELGQVEAVRAAVEGGAPFLGICLGMHLMFEAGEEHAPEGGPLPAGLGLIPGVVGALRARTRPAAPTRCPTWDGTPWSTSQRARRPSRDVPTKRVPQRLEMPCGLFHQARTV